VKVRSRGESYCGGDPGFQRKFRLDEGATREAIKKGGRCGKIHRSQAVFHQGRGSWRSKISAAVDEEVYVHNRRKKLTKRTQKIVTVGGAEGVPVAGKTAMGQKTTRAGGLGLIALRCGLTARSAEKKGERVLQKEDKGACWSPTFGSRVPPNVRRGKSRNEYLGTIPRGLRS